MKSPELSPGQKMAEVRVDITHATDEDIARHNLAQVFDMLLKITNDNGADDWRRTTAGQALDMLYEGLECAVDALAE